MNALPLWSKIAPTNPFAPPQNAASSPSDPIQFASTSTPEFTHLSDPAPLSYPTSPMSLFEKKLAARQIRIGQLIQSHLSLFLRMKYISHRHLSPLSWSITRVLLFNAMIGLFECPFIQSSEHLKRILNLKAVLKLIRVLMRELGGNVCGPQTCIRFLAAASKPKQLTRRRMLNDAADIMCRLLKAK